MDSVFVVGGAITGGDGLTGVGDTIIGVPSVSNALNALQKS